MKINENTKIIGKNVILVPYEAKHVEKYHKWMKSEELQEFTASEPLTIEEEYSMQNSWRDDEDKCTFLILDKMSFEETYDEIGSLIGDTNIFLRKEDNEIVGEIEIMIAEQLSRGKRFGWESTLQMLNYGVQTLGIKKFIAITKYNNEKSINMFKKLRFDEIKRAIVFKEITFGVNVDQEWSEWVRAQIHVRIEDYHK